MDLRFITSDCNCNNFPIIRIEPTILPNYRKWPLNEINLEKAYILFKEAFDWESYFSIHLNNQHINNIFVNGVSLRKIGKL